MGANNVPIHRSFLRDVQRPIESLENVSVETLRKLEYGMHRYPLLCLTHQLKSSDSRNLPTVLITAGLHGDEPAGVHAALDFLREWAGSSSQDYRFVVFPCVNPSGYEANTLETMSGVNLNRSFGSNSSQAEVQAIECWLARQDCRFRLTFDLHEIPPYYRGEGFVETDNPTGTYIYETVTDDCPRIGSQMIASLPEGVEVCKWPAVYHDVNDGGVVAYPGACRNRVYAEKTSIDAFLNGRFTSHSFTTETPTVWDFEKRVATHLSYLRTALGWLAAHQ